MGKVGAPYGNKNAEKWTFKKAVQLYRDAIELTKEQETYLHNGNKVTGYKHDFIGEVARELGTFHLIFAHLVDRFPQLQRLKSELDNNIESNCYFNTKKGIIKEATGIVNLKSNWKWTDRSQIDNSGKIEVTTKPDLTKLSENELRTIAELQRKSGIST
jgi:hypothetical protein